MMSAMTGSLDEGLAVTVSDRRPTRAKALVHVSPLSCLSGL